MDGDIFWPIVVYAWLLGMGALGGWVTLWWWRAAGTKAAERRR